MRKLFFGLLIFALFGFCYFLIDAQASIVLKLIAVNPSKTETQKVPIRAYLPKELKAEDILDKGDLEASYDAQQGSFCVYGEYEVKPGQSLEKEIEVRDVWAIPEADIASLRSETAKLNDLLKNTDFAERISFLKNSIDTKLNQIEESQKSNPPNPEQHISVYRENLQILDAVKSDLALARSLLAQVKPLPSVVIWRLIVGIVIFLGVLGVSFYIIWQKQLKTITQDDTFFVPKEDQPAETGSPSRHEGEGGKPAQGGDVDKILEEEPKE